MPMRNLSVLQAKRLGVYTVSPDETLLNTAHKMRDHNVSALVVTDADGFLAGVISRTDLVKACFKQREGRAQVVIRYPWHMRRLFVFA